jgi:2-methylcitrate dehydratase
VSVALLDGQVTGESFAEARLADPQIARLMRKVKVREDRDLSAQYPDGSPGRVTVRMMSGQVVSGEVRYPKGHFRSPMSDTDVERKFRALCMPRLGKDRCDAVLRAVWKLENVEDVGREVVALLNG